MQIRVLLLKIYLNLFFPTHPETPEIGVSVYSEMMEESEA